MEGGTCTQTHTDNTQTWLQKPPAQTRPRRARRDRCLVKGEGWETEPSVEGSRWFGFRSQGCRTGRGSSAAPETRSSTAPGTRGWEPRHGHCSHGGWCIMLNVCAVKLHFENWRSDVDLHRCRCKDSNDIFPFDSDRFAGQQRGCSSLLGASRWGVSSRNGMLSAGRSCTSRTVWVQGRLETTTESKTKGSC